MKQFVLNCCHDPIILTAMVILASLVAFTMWYTLLKDDEKIPGVTLKIIGATIIGAPFATGATVSDCLGMSVFLVCWCVFVIVFVAVVTVTCNLFIEI